MQWKLSFRFSYGFELFSHWCGGDERDQVFYLPKKQKRERSALHLGWPARTSPWFIFCLILWKRLMPFRVTKTGQLVHRGGQFKTRDVVILKLSQIPRSLRAVPTVAKIGNACCFWSCWMSVQLPGLVAEAGPWCSLSVFEGLFVSTHTHELW